MDAIRSLARRLCSGVFFLVLTHSAPATGQPLTDGNPPADVTRQTLFSIPFYLTPNAPPPTEIHLYVSGDRGQTWSLYQRRQPQQAKFDFQAGKDGEYWFVVRTNEDQKTPNDSTRPEKIVLVDRANPALRVDVSLGATGELIAHYVAEDANLNSSSLRLEYRTAQSEPWQPIPVDRHTAGELNPSGSIDGKASWVLAQAPGVIMIRGEITDRAGNRGTFEDSVDLSQQSTSASRPMASAPTSPPGPLPPTTTLSSDRGSVGTSNLPWLSTTTTPDKPETPSGWRTLDSAWPAAVETINDRESASLDAAEHPGANPQVGAVTSDSSFTSQRPADPLSDDYAPPVANRVASPTPRSEADVQMTNSRRFNLDYDVTGNGSLGVARVELWVSQDQGMTWQPFGLDRDLESPFLVELDREGMYGFRLLVHLQDGISARPPQPGDVPDLTVGLDWTAPRAQLLTATVATAGPTTSTSPTGTTLEITWQAEDEFLVDRPIRLSYAPSVDGPWSQVTTDLPNTGSYRWEHDQPLPARTYLKLEVRDRAGNVTTDLLSEPIGAGGVGPRGVLRGIRPVE